MSKPDVGDMAPQFTLPTDGGGEFTLSAKNDSKIVIFFYPKDDTPGCTVEAIDFTASKGKFATLGAQIFGMSPDPVKKHDKFKLKHEIDVTLISDEEKTVLEAYGVWIEKSMYGRKYMGGGTFNLPDWERWENHSRMAKSKSSRPCKRGIRGHGGFLKKYEQHDNLVVLFNSNSKFY